MTDKHPVIPTIAQLQENSLSSVARHEIERMILSGEIVAGSRVNENGLAASLGVSRGPIREACRALVELGLLELVPGRGVFVRKMDKQDANEIYDLRAGLTGLASFLLAPVITDDQLAEIKSIHMAMEEAASDDDFQAFYHANLDFHDLIVAFTENSRLIKSYRALVKEFHLFRTHGLVQADAQRTSNDEHRAIVAALEARDAQAAYTVSFQHVINGKGRMLTALENMSHATTAIVRKAATKRLRTVD